MINLVAVGSIAPTLWVNVFSDAPPGPLSATIESLGVAAAFANLAVLAWALRKVVRTALSSSESHDLAGW